jgi:flagellar hook-associated protein 3 FlgL
MSQTLNNVYNDVSFALHLHSEAMARLQEQMATGSRINRASDSPSDAYKVLELSSQKNALENFIDRISEVSGTLQLSSGVIADAMSELAEVRTRMTQITNGIYTQEQRERAAEGIDDILEHIASLANTKYINQYIFAGSDTDSPPYVIERTNGQITAVTYQGSFENQMVEVAPGVQASQFRIGQDVFCSNDRSEPVFSGDTGAGPGTGTASVCGDVWLTVIHDGSNYKLSIDDGAIWVTVPVGGDANQAVTDSRTGKVLYVDSTQINSTGVELVRVPGTYDVFSALISIRDLLTNERGLSQAQLQELGLESIASIEELDNLLARAQISAGSKIGYLENLTDSLKNLTYSAEDEVARLENADIAQVAMDLARQEVLYQMSLAVAGRIMSISLLDFIG